MTIEALSEVFQWIVLLAMVALNVGLVYLVGDLNRRLGPDPGALIPSEGLEQGTEVPDLAGMEVRTGEMVRLSDLLGRTVVVTFLSPTCGPCVSLVPHLNRLAGERRGIPFIVVAAEGKGMDYAAEMSALVKVIGDPGQKLQQAFRVRYVPVMCVVDPEGKVAMRAVANDLPQMEDALLGIGHVQASPWIEASR